MPPNQQRQTTEEGLTRLKLKRKSRQETRRKKLTKIFDAKLGTQCKQAFIWQILKTFDSEACTTAATGYRMCSYDLLTHHNSVKLGVIASL